VRFCGHTTYKSQRGPIRNLVTPVIFRLREKCTAVGPRHVHTKAPWPERLCLGAGGMPRPQLLTTPHSIGAAVFLFQFKVR